MSQRSARAPEIPLDLTPPEQWLVRGLLYDKVERAWRREDRPPEDLARVYEKLEDGRHQFTPGELRRLRAELSRAASRGGHGRPDRFKIYRIAERIARALAGYRAHDPVGGQ